jgi:hypothetical protein
MDELEILPRLRIVGLTLFLEKERTLVFSDTHLGYEEYLNKQGILVPRFQYNSVAAHVKEALKQTNPSTVVINGDLKHEFGTISKQEWSEVLRFLDLFKGMEVVLVKGNHDNIIGPLAGRKNVVLADSHAAGSILITHGDKNPGVRQLRKVDTVVIGHEHPALGLREEGRVEKVKCFLVGRWKSRSLVVMPSLNFVAEGVDVLRERMLSPLLQQNMDDFRAIAVEDGVLMDFGRLGRLHAMDV